VCDPATLVVAFERVAGNTGGRTPGVDGVRADHVRAFGAEAYLTHIQCLLKARTFRPLPVKERVIPKSGGKLRRLGIPTIADRVVQAALKLVLEPIWEADFRSCSYGFRPCRRSRNSRGLGSSNSPGRGPLVLFYLVAGVLVEPVRPGRLLGR